ncbi:MAG: thioredoxin fold domain-containing protein [Glaciecola sp.]|jgi:thiol:disulfide interchange protein DsbC|nr:thioredoxin fold domain-containing protein [Glaciecola sp.]MDG1816944.1 thioredoxin fold domain-containing protein [Glaciecola sp.]MDG2100042.1 thioredoxin fold domain-containing protein [Glaciecola sp.]
MKIVLIKQAVLSLFILVSISACAQEAENSPAQTASLTSANTIVLSDELIEKFQRNTRLSILNVEQSPLDNLYQITTDRGIFYLSKDGQFFINAVIFNLDKGMLNETDIAMNGIRLQKVADIRDSGIVYKAANEKYIVDVFTDITCGYCRKLHREMQDYLDAGISIRYLAYPREGLNGDVFKQMQSIWCATNRQDAMDQAKGGDTVASLSCKNEVAKHYQTGGAIGVTGTPNIVVADGSLIGGYQPASALLAELKKRLGE